MSNLSWVETLTKYCASQVTEEVRESLWSRGADDTQIDLYGIGYLSGNPPDVGHEGFAKWFNRHKERLGDQLVFPLTNSLGEVKGVQFRARDRARKGYIDYFMEDQEPVLFGLGQAMSKAWDLESVWIVEGVFDLFPIQRHYPNVIPTLTAKVNPSLERLLRRVVTSVYISYDMDETGRRGGDFFKNKYGKNYQTTTIVTYPEVKKVDGSLAKDPGDYWEAWGDDRLRDFLRCNISCDDSSAVKLEQKESKKDAYDIYYC